MSDCKQPSTLQSNIFIANEIDKKKIIHSRHLLNRQFVAPHHRLYEKKRIREFLHAWKSTFKKICQQASIRHGKERLRNFKSGFKHD